MAFRGVLLQLLEAESGAGFRVVAPDAELTLPPRPVPARETLLTKWSQQKLVVCDAVTHKLRQVARLATVALQHDERSVLWAVTAPFVPPESRTVGATPLDSYADAPHTPRPKGTAERVCYCFHFRSEFEFKLFARTLEAFTRMQRYALLQRSVMMEMEITEEHKRRKVVEDARLQVAAEKVKKRQERKEMKAKKDETATARIKAATPPAKMICISCRMQRKPDAPEYPMHPFVLKDGKGQVVHICKVCLQRVLQQRVKMPPVEKEGDPDNFCGLCAQSTANMSAKSMKACAHPICTRVYCMPCIDKLIGKAQSHKVWRTKNWFCPNCSTEDDATAGQQTNAAAEPGKPASTQRKRKRRNEIEDTSTADEDGPAPVPKPANSTSDMQPIDYAVTYFKFLLKRETKDVFEESEDVCFCCKDGGDVIECDWKGMSGGFERCPKVYHEDCLGYEVPEGKTWVCPRHRCQDCGIIALFSCRFCVTSYCEDHLPKEVRKLGHATKDIPTSTYVMCPRCTDQAQDALKQKKIGLDFHSRISRRRAGKR